MREKFLKERERVQNSGFDEKFQRMWNGYFAYDWAGFSTRSRISWNGADTSQ
jgi:phosphate-selective porin